MISCVKYCVVFRYCDIFYRNAITHSLQLVADPAGPAFDLEAPMEVIIGTVPLQNVQHMYSNAPSNALSTFGGVMPGVGGTGGGATYQPPPYDPSAPPLPLTQEAREY